MPARNVFLRIMLWSLGIAAAGGVLVVLTQNRSVAWRIVATGITTALACGIMIPVGVLVDRKETRAAGLFGMGAVVVEFLFSLLLIWELPSRLIGTRLEDEIGATMGLGALASILVLVLLLISRRPYGAWSGRVGVVLVPAAFAAWLVAVWMPYDEDTWRTRNQWDETGFAVLIFASLAVVCLIGGRTDPARRWRWGGVVAGAVACSMWLLHIWIGTGSDVGDIVFSGLLSLATVVAHANLCVRAPLASGHVWVRNGTIIAAALTAALIEFIVIDERLFDIGLGIDVLVRLPAASGIVAGCGSLALVVLGRLNRKVDLEPYTADLTRISVVCPRCRKKQMIDLGNSVCVGCKLRISIRIEEPRCPSCDYLLFGLTSDRCPECGTFLGEITLPVKG